MSDADIVTLDLPWPPTVNAYWIPTPVLPTIKELAKAPKDPARLFHWLRTHVRGTNRLSKEATAYRKVVIAAVREADPPSFGRQALQANITMYPPRRGCDIDNYDKGLLDALEAAELLHNDSQIRAKFNLVARPCTGGRITITLQPFGA